MRIVIVLLLISVVYINVNIVNANNIVTSNNVVKHIDKYLTLNGGKKKDLGLITMFRAFWLTLINPEVNQLTFKY